MSGKILAGRYHLVEKIGEGGMAIVYRAIDQNTGHSVAIKVLKKEFSKDADYVSRFQREAEAASKMTHHNIVNLLDVGMDGSDRYLVMEYVQGITLKQLIQEKGRLSASTAAQITIRILSALQHAHENGIIHRDIKPQNILVAADGHVKVADFGIARIANSYTLTRDDSVMGTVYYYSPEQASGQKVGVTSDIYSVGVVMYEMLTGHVPFDGETQVAIAMQHLHAQPEPIEKYAPEVPVAIRHVVMMAMTKDPRHRYQSARDMAMELRKALEGRVTEMQPRVSGPEDFVPEKKAEPSQRERPPEGFRIRRRQPMTRAKAAWWAATALMAVLVAYGLYVGGMSIYEKVVNTATVPDMENMELAKAERSAILNGLNVEVVEINHPTISAGTVIMQSPSEGTMLRKGDSVVVTVSKGPASQAAPRVVGMTLTDAITAAQGYGLTLTVVEYVVSGEVQAGFVLSQVPEEGSQCQAGDIIQVTVSGGLVNVPGVEGRTLSDARELLLGSGLSVANTVQLVTTEEESLHGVVASQSPASGSQVIQGTTMTLTVYQVPGVTREAQVTLTLPESEETILLRVGLVENGTENMVCQESVAPDAPRTVEVTLSSQLPGTYTYRVYYDDRFAYQDIVTME